MPLKHPYLGNLDLHMLGKLSFICSSSTETIRRQWLAYASTLSSSSLSFHFRLNPRDEDDAIPR